MWGSIRKTGRYQWPRLPCSYHWNRGGGGGEEENFAAQERDKILFFFFLLYRPIFPLDPQWLTRQLHIIKW